MLSPELQAMEVSPLELEQHMREQTRKRQHAVEELLEVGVG